MLSIYLSTPEHHRESEIEAFCLSYGHEFVWLDDYTAKFQIEQSQAIQLRVLYEPLRDDLGIKLTMIIGFDHESLMRLALAMASESYAGKVMELGDVLVLNSSRGDQRLVIALDQLLSRVTKEVMDSARMYLLTGGNSVQASRLLYVHRNTFSYRLTKFIDQTNIDLRESSLAFFLHIFFTLQQTINQ